MDFRKVESGNMEIMRKAGNLKVFLEEIVLPFQAAAHKTHVELLSHCILAASLGLDTETACSHM